MAVLASATQEPLGLLVCSFSRDGTYIVAGANDCCMYAWHWDIGPTPASAKGGGNPGFYTPAEDTSSSAVEEGRYGL